MDYFKLSMQIVSAILSAYMIVLIVRVLMSWFRGDSFIKVKEFLSKITDPYLDRFRSIEWLRIGMLDLSAVVGISVLGIITRITSILGARGFISWIDIGLIILQHIVSLVNFFFVMIIIVCIIRLISTMIPSWKNHQFFAQLDMMLYRLTSKILGFFTQKPVAYQTALIITTLIFIAISIGIRIGFAYLWNYLQGLANAVDGTYSAGL